MLPPLVLDGHMPWGCPEPSCQPTPLLDALCFPGIDDGHHFSSLRGVEASRSKILPHFSVPKSNVSSDRRSVLSSKRNTRNTAILCDKDT